MRFVTWFYFTLVLSTFLLSPGRAAKAKDEKFQPLFNGKDLTGWKVLEGKEKAWSVEEGMIVVSGEGGGWLGTERDYADFVLRLEYRLTPKGNSGVYLRAPEKGHISRVGMEIQILDDDHPDYKKIAPYQFTGSLYHVVAPSEKAIKPPGEWNAFEITAKGRKLSIVLNGKKIVDTDLDECLKDPEVAKEHAGLKRSTGKIGLQSHNGRVEFRNIQIKELK